MDDSWFKSPDTFLAYKRPIPVSYTIGTSTGTVETLEGPVQYVPGARIITGPKGEKYPVSEADFATLYDENGDGTASPKKIIKQVRLADHNGSLVTNWGELEYTTGNDYIVRHGSGDYGAIKVDIFKITYELYEK